MSVFILLYKLRLLIVVGIIILIPQTDDLINAFEVTQHAIAASSLMILIKYSLWVNTWLSSVNYGGYYLLNYRSLVDDLDSQALYWQNAGAVMHIDPLQRRIRMLQLSIPFSCQQLSLC